MAPYQGGPGPHHLAQMVTIAVLPTTGGAQGPTSWLDLMASRVLPTNEGFLGLSTHVNQAATGALPLTKWVREPPPHFNPGAARAPPTVIEDRATNSSAQRSLEPHPYLGAQGPLTLPLPTRVLVPQLGPRMSQPPTGKTWALAPCLSQVDASAPSHTRWSWVPASSSASWPLGCRTPLARTGTSLTGLAQLPWGLSPEPGGSRPHHYFGPATIKPRPHRGSPGPAVFSFWLLWGPHLIRSVGGPSASLTWQLSWPPPK